MQLLELSERLVKSLQLSVAPVSLAFMDEPPPEVPTFDSVVPSACAFWVRAEKGLFYAKAESHENCPVGVLTMGFPFTPKVMSTLDEFVQKMCQASYIGAREPEHIPRLSSARKGILYGPLAHFPVSPDLTLIWVNGRQAMILEEALGTVCWDVIKKGELFGRPACAALAVAANEAKSTVSLGCSGMRTFTGVSDDKILVSIPVSVLESLSAGLVNTVQSNSSMLDFYRQHLASFGDS
jgi:uncharacterized protein (DUF169 family)